METQQKQNRRRVQLAVVLIVFVLSVVGLASTRPTATSSAPQASATYIIDNQKGKFVAHAFAGGVFWFKGHDHYLAARDFSGEVELTPDSVTPASLHLVVKAASLEETGTVFTDAQKQIINKEVHDLVLLPDKYPDITFQSTSVTAKPAAAGQYEVKIVGNLTLLGVTRQETIPVKLSLSNNDLQAVGEFSIDRDDYKVKATSAFHGFVRVKDKIRFEFDIVAHRR
jgi:polyisoprenoid-binding protein YceI